MGGRRLRGEAQPARAVGAQPRPIQLRREQPLAVAERRGLVSPLQPGPPPGALVALDDEGAHLAVEWVAVHLEEAVL